MSFTLVAFHAHPDDESLLTGGTLARAAAEGHRVVLVVATLGGAGRAADPRGEALARRRHAELLAAADALGCARVELLGYADSGLAPQAPTASPPGTDPPAAADASAVVAADADPVRSDLTGARPAAPASPAAGTHPPAAGTDPAVAADASAVAATDADPVAAVSTGPAGGGPASSGPADAGSADARSGGAIDVDPAVAVGAGPVAAVAAPAGRPVAAVRFVDAPVEEAARRLAAVLREESAQVLVSYDPRGGYGHPDHVQVHRVGALAATLAEVPVVLEATIDRDSLRPLLHLLRLAGRLLPGLPLGGPGTVFTPRREITHVVDVRSYLAQKRAALAAHASQTEGGGLRTVSALLRLPNAVFARVAGREWFVEAGRPPGPVGDDIFARLR